MFVFVSLSLSLSLLVWKPSYVKSFEGHAVDGINSATLRSSEALQVVHHRNKFGALKIQYDGQMFVLGAFSENVFSPKGRPKKIDLVSIK